MFADGDIGETRKHVRQHVDQLARSCHLMNTVTRLATYIRDISQGSPHGDVSKLNLHQTLKHQFLYSDAELETVNAQIAWILLSTLDDSQLVQALAFDLVVRDIGFTRFLARRSEIASARELR
jgi:hypothetical protein